MRAKISNKGRLLMSAFERAARKFENIGMMYPEDYPGIEKKYWDSKEAIRKYIAELEERFSKL